VWYSPRNRSVFLKNGTFYEVTQKNQKFLYSLLGSNHIWASVLQRIKKEIGPNRWLGPFETKLTGGPIRDFRNFWIFLALSRQFLGVARPLLKYLYVLYFKEKIPSGSLSESFLRKFASKWPKIVNPSSEARQAEISIFFFSAPKNPGKL